MSTMKEIRAAMKQKLDEGREALDDLKATAKAAGHHSKEEVSEAVHKAEGMLAQGRSRLAEIAEKSEDDFDVWWATSKKHWHALRRDMDDHWDHLTRKLKDLGS